MKKGKWQNATIEGGGYYCPRMTNRQPNRAAAVKVQYTL
jgi:hypothetical protein